MALDKKEIEGHINFLKIIRKPSWVKQDQKTFTPYRLKQLKDLLIKLKSGKINLSAFCKLNRWDQNFEQFPLFLAHKFGLVKIDRNCIVLNESSEYYEMVKIE